jgi:hypothetical protein
MSAKRRTVRDRSLLAVSLLAVSACYQGPEQDDDGGVMAEAPERAPERAPGHEPASIDIEVVTREGRSIAGARVTVDALQLTVAVDSDGHAHVEDLPAARFVARVDADGHVPGGLALELPAGAAVSARVTLVELVEYPSFDAAQGGEIVTDTVRVSIPADALVDPLNPTKTLTGPITPTIVPFDPTRDLAVLPGPLRAGEDLLESVYMADITLWQDGRPLQLRDGMSAHVALRVPSGLARRYEHLDSVPAWSYDYQQGTWVCDGELAGVLLTHVEDATLWWHVDLPHFSLWNADVLVTEITCIDVHVFNKDDMSDIESVLVTLVGVSYDGYDNGVTDVGGKACLEMPRDCNGQVCAGTLYVGSLNDPEAVSIDVAGSMAAAACGGQDCTAYEVPVTPGAVCSPNIPVACGAYTGPEGTENVGECKGPSKTCNPSGTGFDQCTESKVPILETGCDNKDQDCDGLKESDPKCFCLVPESCYTGTPGTEGIGECSAGTRDCVANELGPDCIGETTDTEFDVLADNKDNDCDGLVDEDDQPIDWCEGGSWISTNLEIPDTGGDDGSQVATDVAYDPLSGSVFVAGFFSHGLTFPAGCQADTYSDDNDVFLARFENKDCKQLLTFNPGAAIQLEVRVAVSPTGETWLTGQCDGAVEHGALVANCGSKGSFIAKIEADTVVELTALDYVAADVTAPLDDVSYVVGERDEVVVVDGIDQASRRLVVDRRGPNPQEFMFAEDNNQQRGRRVEALGAGIVVTGTYQGTPSLGGDQQFSAGRGIFMARMDVPPAIDCTTYLSAPDGVLDNEVDAIAVGDGLVVVGGRVSGSLHIPPDAELTYEANRAAFLVALDAGTCAATWSAPFPTTGEYASFHGLTFDGGRLFAGGGFSGAITVAGSTFDASAVEQARGDILLVQLNPLMKGKVMWSASFGGPDTNERLLGLAPGVHGVGQAGTDIEFKPVPDATLDVDGLADAFLIHIK